MGPLLQVEVYVPSALEQLLIAQNQPIPPPRTGWALIDTGATKSCVDINAISTLGVNPIGVTLTGTAGGQVQQPLYPARFRFPGEAFEQEFSSVIGVDLTGQSILGQDIIVLLGRDVLAKCVLIYNGPGGFFTLTL
jgi:predicted aspartyl protease